MSGTWSGARGTVLSQSKTATGATMQMEHAFSTADGGVVRTKDEVQLTPVEGKPQTFLLELAYTVVEAFGPLKGYSGTFNSFGLIKLENGKALVRCSGQICK